MRRSTLSLIALLIVVAAVFLSGPIPQVNAEVDCQPQIRVNPVNIDSTAFFRVGCDGIDIKGLPLDTELGILDARWSASGDYLLVRYAKDDAGFDRILITEVTSEYINITAVYTRPDIYGYTVSPTGDKFAVDTGSEGIHIINFFGESIAWQTGATGYSTPVWGFQGIYYIGYSGSESGSSYALNRWNPVTGEVFSFNSYPGVPMTGQIVLEPNYGYVWLVNADVSYRWSDESGLYVGQQETFCPADTEQTDLDIGAGFIYVSCTDITGEQIAYLFAHQGDAMLDVEGIVDPYYPGGYAYLPDGGEIIVDVRG